MYHWLKCPEKYNNELKSIDIHEKVRQSLIAKSQILVFELDLFNPQFTDGVTNIWGFIGICVLAIFYKVLALSCDTVTVIQFFQE